MTHRLCHQACHPIDQFGSDLIQILPQGKLGIVRKLWLTLHLERAAEAVIRLRQRRAPGWAFFPGLDARSPKPSPQRSHQPRGAILSRYVPLLTRIFMI